LDVVMDNEVGIAMSKQAVAQGSGEVRRGAWKLPERLPMRRVASRWKMVSAGLLVVGAGALGCKGPSSDATGAAPAGSGAPATTGVAPQGAPSGQAPAVVTTDPNGVVVAVPVPAEKVAKVVNPKGEKAYKGPTGTLKGVVRIKGDPSVPIEYAFPPGCGEAAATHGKLFRTGQDGTLADVMVAVTGYEGFVPPREPAEKTTIHGCALQKRTMAVAYGQRIEVSNLDRSESYMPYLDGAPFRAVLVAMPGGDSVKFYPQEPGHYLIRDQLPKPYLTADVYVVAYATHDVTGLDGQFEIPDIPVGKVKASAFLPAIDKVSEQQIEIKAGENTLDFVLEFSREEYQKKIDASKKPPAVAPAPTIGPKG
jgi:hypothetical protein